MSVSTPFDFNGYRVAVAGGSKGIGRAIALGFLEGGAQVSGASPKAISLL